jgi:SAM-dependent methyltransferase
VVDDFLASGEEHVAHALERFECLGGTFPDHEMVVDFGCGVGRLTQPLADRFELALGVDISPTMIEVAKRLNSRGSRARYVVNQEPDLAFLPDDSASLVMTHITLQHIPPDVTKRYLDEFLRVLKPSGGLIFQLPSHLSTSYLPDGDRGGEAVPHDGRKARINASHLPRVFVSGQVTPIRVRVRNDSECEWVQTADHPFNLGNHWCSAEDENVIEWDDGRERLPGRLRPEQETEICLPVVPPSEPGRYRLQIDIVQEGVAWFAESGSEVLDCSVEVVDDPGLDYEGYAFSDLLSDNREQAPQFDMNGIPTAEVEEILERRGAALLGMDEHITEWHSFVYYVQAGRRH